MALVFARKEPPAIAKVLSNYAKEHEKLTLVGGCYESLILTQEEIKKFAKIPSREILLAQVCGTLNASITKLAQVLNAILIRPLVLIKEIEKNKS